jgi:hypothetical protein
MGLLTLSLMLAWAAPAAWARGEAHLRVEVVDERTGEMKVNLDMPLNAVESILDIINEQVHGDVGMDFDFGDHGMDVRKIYLALRDSDMSDFLEVNDGDTHVKVFMDRDAFQVRATEDGNLVASVYLPIQVLDALFSGPEDELPNTRAALKELASLAPITLVEVYEDHETVKIWVE